MSEDAPLYVAVGLRDAGNNAEQVVLIGVFDNEEVARWAAEQSGLSKRDYRVTAVMPDCVLDTALLRIVPYDTIQGSWLEWEEGEG